MTLAVFDITNITQNPSTHNLWSGEVRFSFDEVLNDIEVANWITIKVRVIVSETTTLQELREIFFQKALAQLSLVNSTAVDKTAQQLLHDARVRAEEGLFHFS